MPSVGVSSLSLGHAKAWPLFIQHKNSQMLWHFCLPAAPPLAL